MFFFNHKIFIIKFIFYIFLISKCVKFEFFDATDSTPRKQRLFIKIKRQKTCHKITVIAHSRLLLRDDDDERPIYEKEHSFEREKHSFEKEEHNFEKEKHNFKEEKHNFEKEEQNSEKEKQNFEKEKKSIIKGKDENTLQEQPKKNIKL